MHPLTEMLYFPVRKVLAAAIPLKYQLDFHSRSGGERDKNATVPKSLQASITPLRLNSYASN